MAAAAMNSKSLDFLAAALLESVADEDWSNVQILVQKHKAPGTRLVHSKGIAAIHYAAGMDEVEFGRQVIELILLENGAAAIDVQTDEGETALHVATFWGRTKIVDLLLKNGASMDVYDSDRNTAVQHAIDGKLFDIVDMFKHYAFERKQGPKVTADAYHTPRKMPKMDTLAVPKYPQLLPLGRNKLAAPCTTENHTPTRKAYNFDATSPYYVNITHRGNRMQHLHEIKSVRNESYVNLFLLTRESVEEFTRLQSPEEERVNYFNYLIDKWRRKVDPIARDIDAGAMSLRNVDEWNGEFEEESSILPVLPTLDASVDARQDSIQDAISAEHDQSEFIRSPRRSDGYQMIEKYLHLDSSAGISIYEKKLLRTSVERSVNLNENIPLDETGASSAASTEVTIPLEYDTDQLRAELTQFGAAPGPISSTTKKLYMKRLMRFKKHAKTGKLSTDAKKMPPFSCEMERALLADGWSQKLAEYAALVPRLTESFRMPKTARQVLREGHRKTCFVYLLIDPRIAENLVGNSMHVSNLEMWDTFVRSIFYVGKGQNNRPFEHLYDAIKVFNANVGASGPNAHIVGAKIKRILDIWSTDKGVICQQVFRNIIPSEALTREAAIIDAIGLANLTNVKSGDYYGSVKAWRMRDRKQLGVALLYNALHVMLADGESQLRPDDLF